MNDMRKPILVIGHRNPDTDSICSAIAYANLKTRTSPEDGPEYRPCRAGIINSETRFVLKYFEVPPPQYVSSVKQQVEDIEINYIQGISSDDSMKRAWDIMHDNIARSLPVIDGGILKGILSITDIAKSYMSDCDGTVLSSARTSYGSIAETLRGKVLLGSGKSLFKEGKVTIAASSPDLMEAFIEAGDLVILGNRFESHFCAIEMGAKCLVMCQDSKPTKTIRKLAKEHDCVIISTPYDSFTVARLINQSIPVSYFMTKGELITFRLTDLVDDVGEIMKTYRFHNFPVIDRNGMFVGFVSRRRLLDIKRKQMILVDHNEISQAVDGIEEATVLEIIDHHRLGGLETIGPVYFRNQPVGCTATIISQLYDETGLVPDEKTAGLLAAAILSDTLIFKSPTCTPLDMAACEKLCRTAGIDPQQFGSEMFRAGSDVLDKNPKEIIYHDFKKFDINECSFGIGQITSANQEELMQAADKVEGCLNKAAKEQKLDMIFLMLTNFSENITTLLCSDDNAVNWRPKHFNCQMAPARSSLKIYSRERSSSCRYSPKYSTAKAKGRLG